MVVLCQWGEEVGGLGGDFFGKEYFFWQVVEFGGRVVGVLRFVGWVEVVGQLFLGDLGILGSLFEGFYILVLEGILEIFFGFFFFILQMEICRNKGLLVWGFEVIWGVMLGKGLYLKVIYFFLLLLLLVFILLL